MLLANLRNFRHFAADFKEGLAGTIRIERPNSVIERRRIPTPIP